MVVQMLVLASTCMLSVGASHLCYMLTLIQSKVTSTVAHMHGGTGMPTIISCVMTMISLSC